MGKARLEKVYEAERQALVRFAASQVGPADVDDVVSEAVLALATRDLSSVDNLRAYLYQAVASAAKRHWRSLDRRTRRERLAAPGPESVGVPDPQPEVLTAISRLSPQQRAVIHLTYWEDLTPVAVARLLDVSEGTVRRQLNRARRRLRSALAAEHSHPNSPATTITTSASSNQVEGQRP